MFQYQQYYGRFQNARGHWTGLPKWARTIVFIASVPGLLLIGLSLVAFLVSLLALLILTLPVYQVMKGLTRSGRLEEADAEVVAYDSPGARKIDVKIIDQ